MLNRIFLIGHLGRDPEMSFTESGKQRTKFTLAVNRQPRGKKDGGEPVRETDWFTVVAWDRLGEICANYLHKGSKVFIEGRIESYKFTDKNGVERTMWEVTATEMRMLDGKDAASGAAPARVGAAEGGSAGGDSMGAEDIPF
jgi:single-strand DNA-binding protein